MSKQYTVKVIDAAGVVVKATASTTHTMAFKTVGELQPQYPRTTVIVLYEADRVMDSFSGLKGV